MDFLSYDALTEENLTASIGGKRKRNGDVVTVAQEICGNMKQRSQANARERDRTHR